MKHTLKKVLALGLALLLVFPLASCTLFKKPEARSENFSAVRDGTAVCTIVYPGGSDTMWKSLANELARVIRRVTDTVLTVTPDTADATGNEILLGTTNRPASTAAVAALNGSKTAFSFSVSEGSLVIAAANPDALAMAIAYFDAQYDGTLGGTAGTGNLTFPSDLSLTRTTEAPSSEPWQLISATAGLGLTSTVAGEIAMDGSFFLVSSATVANGVLYAALTDGNGSVKFVSTELATGKRLVTGNVLTIGASSGMCYNPVLDLLTVVHGDNKVSLIDPATLTLRRTVTAGAAISKIAYDAKNLCYIARKTEDLTLLTLNNNLTLTGEDEISPVTPATLQFEDYALVDVLADSEYYYLLYLIGSENGYENLLIAQSRSNRNKRIYRELPLSGAPLALAMDAHTFYAVSAESNLAGQITRVQFRTDESVSEPANLFNETNTAGVDSAYLSTEELFKLYAFIKNDYSRNTVMQGACTDGKYGYFFLEYQGGKDENGNSNYANSETHDTVIVKMDMTTLELVMVSEPMKLGHSNDGCYNPNTGKLLVVYNGNDKKLVKVVDPNTLTVTEEIRLPVNIFSLSYNPYTRQYVAGLSGGRNFALLDENFNVLDRLDTDYSSYDRDEIYDYKLGSDLLTQGIDCDSQYVYFVLSGRKTTENGKTVWVNYLLAFDYEGVHQFTKVLPTPSLEVENIFHIGKDIYITCNGSTGGSRNPCYHLTVLS